MARHSDLQLLHPSVQEDFMKLREILERDFATGKTLTDFRIFETYREPMDQNEAFRKGASKAKAWQSPHQYGLAADFVAWIKTDDGYTWSWDKHHDWAHLKKRALECKMDCPISWDRCHVEHPNWQRARIGLRSA